MNERATEVTDESEKPEDQENNEDGPEHMFSFELVYFASRARVEMRVKIFQIRAIGNCWRAGFESTTTRLTGSTSFLCAPNFFLFFCSLLVSPEALSLLSWWKSNRAKCPMWRRSSAMA